MKQMGEFKAKQNQIPDNLEIQVIKSDDFGYAVKVLNLPGCFTQIENTGELFVMVNDAVCTYFDISKDLVSYSFIDELNLKNVVWKEGKCYVSWNLGTGISSFGETRKEAFEALEEAMSLFSSDFEESLARAEKDYKDGNVTQLKNLKNLD